MRFVEVARGIAQVYERRWEGRRGRDYKQVKERGWGGKGSGAAATILVASSDSPAIDWLLSRYLWITIGEPPQLFVLSIGFITQATDGLHHLVTLTCCLRCSSSLSTHNGERGHQVSLTSWESSMTFSPQLTGVLPIHSIGNASTSADYSYFWCSFQPLSNKFVRKLFPWYTLN